jgi:hypothetical protein
MDVMLSRAGRLRRGAGALVISLAVVAAVVGGYFGLRHDPASGDGGPAARTGAAIAYDPATGDVVLFGGTGSDGQVLAGTWLWDGSGWSEAGPVDSPPARYGAEMAWDPQSQRVILLGGTGGSGCSTGTGSSGTVTGSAGTVSITGGCTQLQDAWAWGGSDWSQIALGNGTGRLGGYTLAGASMATDPTSGKLVLVTANSSSAGPVPLPAIYNSGGASATGSGGASGGVCIGVGGGPCGSPVALPSATSGTSPAQTACPMDGGCVSTLCPATASPVAGVATPAIACAICPATTSGAVPTCGICPEASGGATPSTGSEVICSNCPLEISCAPLAATLTWVFDGSSFQLAGSSATDSPGSGGQLAWFPGPGLLVDLGANLGAVAGGSDLACPYGDPCPLIPAAEDWQWNGGGWTPVQDLQVSAARSFEVPPISDTAAGEVVGLDYTGAIWVSTNPAAGWVTAPSAGAPAARSRPALAYDGSTGQVVLFGGELLGSSSAAGEVVGDTWTWDGTAWTEQEGGAPAPTPSATPVPTTTGLPLLPPLASASAVAVSPSPSSTPPASASASASATATATAGALPTVAPTIG